jgi:hypothetical protein
VAGIFNHLAVPGTLREDLREARHVLATALLGSDLPGPLVASLVGIPRAVYPDALSRRQAFDKHFAEGNPVNRAPSLSAPRAARSDRLGADTQARVIAAWLELTVDSPKRCDELTVRDPSRLIPEEKGPFSIRTDVVDGKR